MKEIDTVRSIIKEAIIKVMLDDGTQESYHVSDEEREQLRSFLTNSDSGLGKTQFSGASFENPENSGYTKGRSRLLKKLEREGLGEVDDEGNFTERHITAQAKLDSLDSDIKTAIVQRFNEDSALPELTKWLDSSGADDNFKQRFLERLSEIYLESGKGGYFANTVDRFVSPGPSELSEFFSFSDPASIGVTEVAISDDSLKGVSGINTMTGGGSKGQEVGKGEIAIPFMFNNSHWASGNAVYDNIIGDIGWHLKELPRAGYDGKKSIRLGKQGYAGSEVQVFLTSVANMDAAALGGLPAGGGKGSSSILRNISKIVNGMRQGSGYFSLSDAEIESEMENEYARGIPERASAIAAIRKIQAKLNEEMIERSVNIDGTAGGVCYYIPETFSFYFHGLDQIGCAGATQGSHKVSGKVSPLLDTFFKNIHRADFHDVDPSHEAAMINDAKQTINLEMGKSLEGISAALIGLGFSQAPGSADYSMRASKRYAENPEIDIRELGKGARLKDTLSQLSDAEIESIRKEIYTYVSAYRDSKNKLGIMSSSTIFRIWKKNGRGVEDVTSSERWSADDIQSDVRNTLGRRFLG